MTDAIDDTTTDDVEPSQGQGQGQGEMVDGVDAVFGGEDVYFTLAGKRLQNFELVSGRSAWRTLNRLMSGVWTVHDLKTVLSHAHEGGIGNGMMTVDRVIDAGPPLKYVHLAILVLSAALAGLKEEDAVFDEADPLRLPSTEAVDGQA